jgi:enterobacterial common antigen flippase
VTLTYFGICYFGLLGTGVSFVGLYAFYCVFVWFVSRKLNRFTWSRFNIVYGCCIVLISLVVFALTFICNNVQIFLIGTVISALLGVYSAKILIGRSRGT